MVWGIRIFALTLLALLLGLLFKPPAPVPVSNPATTATAPISAALSAPTVSSLNTTAPIRVTVYQETAAGVPSFSDRVDRGRPHVIDHAKGSTYQSTYRGEVPNTASVSYTPAEPIGDPFQQLKHDNARFQQQVQQAKQQRMQYAIGE